MRKKFLTIILFIGFLAASYCSAANYTLLEKLPDIGGTSEVTAPDLSQYLQWVFVFAISIAGILAVLMIVVGGIQYITAYGNPGKASAGRERITQALLGLLLAVTAWLILYTINPDFIKGTLLNIPDITINSFDAS